MSRAAKKVVVDARMWAHAGIGRYISELSGALLDRDDGFQYRFLSRPGFKERLSERRACPDAGMFRHMRAGIYGIAEQWEVALKSLDADLLHVPHFNIPVFYPKKLVVTIHDLIYLDSDALRSPLARAYARTLFDLIQRRSDAIITVSQATRAVLLTRFPKLSEKRVFVVPEAASGRIRRIEDTLEIQAVLKRFGLAGPFVLFVGSLKPHKNLGVLIEAMRRLPGGGIHPTLVVAGRSDPKHPEILKQALDCDFAKVLGEVSDADLSALYSGADFFVLPSLCEGFGLPVLEAMTCGTPVLVSNRSSLPEVAGDAAITFDPERVDALSEVIYNVLKNKHLREEMSRKGLERSRAFSWRNTAEQTARVYQRVLEV